MASYILLILSCKGFEFSYSYGQIKRGESLGKIGDGNREKTTGKHRQN